MTAADDLRALERWFLTHGPVVVACSGGVDSLLLATVAHRVDRRTIVAHTLTAAVPTDATARVRARAETEGWELQVVRSSEFDDEAYLSNPTDRCYHCKTHLYDAIQGLTGTDVARERTIVSGANVDDLGEYRPGLVAAEEHEVRHPYVELGVTKERLRAVARLLGSVDADLPASPCLASRLYTGTRVTPTRLRAVEAGERVLRSAGLTVVRCRLRESEVLVEVPAQDRATVTDAMLVEVAAVMRGVEPTIGTVRLDEADYHPGRAFTGAVRVELQGVRH